MHGSISEISKKRCMTSTDRRCLSRPNSIASRSQRCLCPTAPISRLCRVQERLDSLQDRCIRKSRWIGFCSIENLREKTISWDLRIFVEIVDNTPAWGSR